MAKSCVECGRGSLKARSRSHSNITTNRQQKINLQNKIIDGKKIPICTSCLRTKKRIV